MQAFLVRVVDVAVAAMLIAPSVNAQMLIRIGDQIACSSCTVDLQLQATLAPLADRAGFRSLPLPSLARNSQHYYLAGPMVGDSVIAAFLPSGALSHVYGRVGQGPGEFLGPPFSMIIRAGEADILYVIEGRTLHVLNATATKTLRQHRIDVRANDAVILGTTPVLQWAVSEPRGRGTPIQVLTEDGSLRSGIGVTAARPLSRSAPFDPHRKIARGGQGTEVWSAYLNRYEMSRFDLQGREQVRVERVSEWFPAYEDVVRGELFLKPQRPRVEGVLEPRSGLLWVAISHGDEHFVPMTATVGSESEFRIDPYIDFNHYLDTIIEVLDLTEGKVIARRRFDSYLRFVSTPGDDVLFYALRSTESGETVCDIFAGTVAF